MPDPVRHYLNDGVVFQNTHVDRLLAVIQTAIMCFFRLIANRQHQRLVQERQDDVPMNQISEVLLDGPDR